MGGPFPLRITVKKYHPLLSHQILKIESNRKKLALSLYQKGKISIEAASEIAGMNIKDFMEMLEKKKLLS